MTVQEARRRLPRAERERQLIDVAQQVFAEGGFRVASMEEIAIRAGVTKPVLYDHFGSKDGLILACVRQAGARLAEEVAGAARMATGPAALLEAGISGFFRFVESHGQGWFMLLGEGAVLGSAAAELEAIRREQAAYVAVQLAATFPAADPAQLDAFGEAIIGACERVALWRRDRPEVTAEMATRDLMTLLWGGLGALAGSAGSASGLR